jgi:soluble lytic murein transglycosylase-like protein
MSGIAHSRLSSWLQGANRRRDAMRSMARSRAERWLRLAAKAELFIIGALFLLVCFVSASQAFAQPAQPAQPTRAAAAPTIPPAAHTYQLPLRREAQRVWGLNAPVATFAAQLHQESRWRADARSPVGALGLAQFMPATAHWIGGISPSLAQRAPLNPTWSIRALVEYDHWLSQRIKAANACERMAFTLSAYNGGLGWVYKRQQRSATPGLCLGAACTINPGITPASQGENQHYPEIILQRYEPLYAHWGARSCP